MLQKSEKAQTLHDEPRATDSIMARRLMADAANSRTLALSEMLGRGILWAGGVINAYLVNPVAEGFRLRCMYRELMALDDRMLADIGIGCNEIRQVVAKSAVEGRQPADVHVLKPDQGRTNTDDTARPLAA